MNGELLVPSSDDLTKLEPGTWITMFLRKGWEQHKTAMFVKIQNGKVYTKDSFGYMHTNKISNIESVHLYLNNYGSDLSRYANKRVEVIFHLEGDRSAPIRFIGVTGKGPNHRFLYLDDELQVYYNEIISIKTIKKINPDDMYKDLLMA